MKSNIKTINLTSQQEIAEIDGFAYDVTQNWFRRQETEGLEYCRIHFGEVVRRYLWDKVGRALRKKYYPEEFAFENQLLSEDPDRYGVFVPTSFRAERSLYSALRLRLHNVYRAVHNRYLTLKRPGRILILMRASERLGRVTEKLITHSRFAVLSTSVSKLALQTIEPLSDLRASESKVDRIWRIIVTGVEAEGIELLVDDKEVLHHEIAYELERIAATNTYFIKHKPDAVFLAGDNWPPFINFVLLARHYGIPSIYLQHGLDCEHYYADEAYSDAIAVWGSTRKERYERDSNWQPRFMTVTGNPEFEHLSPPESINHEGNYWLWVTRPHTPRKCLSPSRSPKEGMDILEAFANVLRQRAGQTLLIKPHPHDYPELYQRFIEEQGLQDQIQLVSGSPQEWLPSASIVFSEDSTVGMEAMFFGKPLVHVHFCPSQPTMPFTNYGAGYPAFTPEELEEYIPRVEGMSDDDRKKMLDGQCAFLTDFAGPLDGKATQRVVSFIEQVLLGER